MKITYVEKNFRNKSLKLINDVNEIIGEYRSLGYDLTLRQLYYQCVSKNLIPNTERSYKNFGSLISDARLAGLIDWSVIVDRTRVTQTNPHWRHPAEIIKAAYQSYNLDHWENQTYRPRVWIEKEALIGVISETCIELDVPYLACKGYMSQSAMWRDSKKALTEIYRGQIPIIIHLGDHDPSGMQMTEDIGNRMEIFRAEYEVLRIALNMDQVEENNPPPNPAKLSDTRSNSYIRKYGNYSWELDALTPDYINELLRKEIEKLIDAGPWNSVLEKMKYDKSILKALSDNYEEIESIIKDEGWV